MQAAPAVWDSPDVLRVSRSLIFPALVAALFLSGAAQAEAKKVKKKATVFQYGSFTNTGSSIVVDIFQDGHPRCIKAITVTGVKFATNPRRDLDPNAVGQPGSFVGIAVPWSNVFPIQWRPPVGGPNARRGTFYPSQQVTYTNPNGTYAGTYPLSKWWSGLGIPHIYAGTYAWPDKADFRFVHARWPEENSFQTKLRFKKRGVKHVLVCEWEEKPGIPQNGENPPQGGSNPGPRPVPGFWFFGGEVLAPTSSGPGT